MDREERAKSRRARIVVHRAADFADAERWDLRFWQEQTPEARLDALVAIREDVAHVEAAQREAAGDATR